MLNILTGVFVQSTSAVARVDQDLIIHEEMKRAESNINQIRALFAELDSDSSGTITLDELKKSLADHKVRAHFSMLDLDVSSVKGLFKLIDTDESGEVGIDEFIMTCVRLKGGAKSIDQATALFENKKMNLLVKNYLESFSDDIAEMRELIVDVFQPGSESK